MQRFTFSLYDGAAVQQTIAEDHSGLRDAAARAFQMLSELIRDDDHAWALQEWRIDIADADGLILLTIGSYASEAAALKARR